jgi:cyanophycin synthetase
MRVVEITTLSGPNVYGYQPALVMKLHLEELAGKESYEVPGFNDRLLALLPGLRKRHCEKGAEGGFVERLREGAWFGHVVEHVALELTLLAGAGSIHGKTRSAGEPGLFNVIIEYRAEKGTERLMRAAVGLVEALVKGEPYALDEEVAEAKRIIARTELGPSARVIVEAAARRGIPWRRLDDQNLARLGYGKYRRLIEAAMTSQTSAIAVDIASNKDLTKRLLDRAGIPVPQGAVVRSAEDAVNVWEWLRKPVAVKPHAGSQGEGVSLNLYTPEQVAEAFYIARKYSEDVLIEELFIGRDFRALVVGGKMVAASERVPASVVGDGRRSIAELIEVENRNPLRGEGHDSPLTKIEIDVVMTAHLQKSGLSLDAVPPAGERVLLRGNANLSTGGTAIDVTDTVHPQVMRVCERAAQVIGLDLCGIDLVLPDISRPVGEGGAGVIEVNAAPGLRMHAFPSEGKPRDVGAAVVEMLYPPGSPSRIPIISVTGTNGKTTIIRLVARMLSTAGLTVGMATTDGVYVGGELVMAGDAAGPRSAQAVLSDPTVEVAALEVARGGILREGLGYDWSDVSVMSNIQADHWGQDGISSIDDLLFIKSLVAERVREGGALILNADDEKLARLAENPRITAVPKKYVYYSLEPHNPAVEGHTERGGTAFRLDGGWIVESAGGIEGRVVEAAAIPITFGGAAAYQISNVMAAIAAARAYGLPAERVAETLMDYTGVEHNAGRGNLYRVGGGYVLVDYGHNPEAFNAVGRTLRNLNMGRITAVVGVPGDRDDEIIRRAGRAAARRFDRLILREDEDLRGRKSGDVPKLLCLAAAEESPGIECRVVLDEQDALELAISEMREGEIVVIFYEKRLDQITKALERRSATPVATFGAARPVGDKVDRAAKANPEGKKR